MPRGRSRDFVFAGALQLTTPNFALLGGLSDLKVGEDGSLVSETDEGSLLRSEITDPGADLPLLSGKGNEVKVAAVG